MVYRPPQIKDDKYINYEYQYLIDLLDDKKWIVQRYIPIKPGLCSGLWSKRTDISFSNGDDSGLVFIISDKRPYFAQNETEIKNLYSVIYNQLNESQEKAKEIPSIKEYNFELDHFSSYNEPIFISRENILHEKDGRLIKSITEHMIYRCHDNKTCDVSISLISDTETFKKNMVTYNQIKRSLKTHSLK